MDLTSHQWLSDSLGYEGFFDANDDFQHVVFSFIMFDDFPYAYVGFFECVMLDCLLTYVL